MISVGSRDEREGLGLGFGSAGGGRTEMDESDLEEGEACSYPNHEYDEGSIDPDVALSYIDEKIQDVLGHFQKDFEGGVSAENLGAKFGGYGSFLPMHQRSPVWSHPRIPSKTHCQNSPNCSINSQMEAGRGDAVHSSTATHLSGLGPNSTSSLDFPALKAPSLNHGVSQENCPTTTCAEVFTSKYGSTGMKSSSMTDQKTLKVRIKMGTDNLPTQKNAAIYSGLGLDVSPSSSSSDDSPSEGEGISCGPKDAPFESPSSILQIMTSLPKLLSPLPDDLIQLIGEETDSKEGVTDGVHVEESEGLGMLLNESITVRDDRKLLGGKKIKSVEGCGSSLEFKGGINKNGVLLGKEQSNDTLTTDELVSKTLKLPLLSSSFCDDSVKGVGELCGKLKEASESVVKEKIFSDHAQKEQADPKSTEVNGFVEKGQASSGRKTVADKVYNSVDDLSAHTMKDKAYRGKTCDSVTAESIARTALNNEHKENPENAFQMGEQDGMTLSVVREHPIPRGKKKKSKGAHGIMASEGGKQTLRVSNLLLHKTKKSSDDGATSKNENEGIRVQKDHGKAGDAYRDFFGEFEEEEDRLDSLETPYVDKLKDSEVSERRRSASISAATERSGANKVVKPLSSDVYPRTATNLVRCSANGHGTDVDRGKEAPVTGVVFEDNWVQCDRCQKWRLLPAGTNPDHLPEKWLCSMLDWLPDMNRCSVSEDETTKALIALYQGPPPEGQSNLQNAFGSVVGGALSNPQHSDQHWLNHSLRALPDRKKNFSKEMSNAETKDGSFPLSSSVKKGLHSSVKSRSLNDVNKSPALHAVNAPVEKHKTKHKIMGGSSDIGDRKNLKVKSKRDPDQDCSRSFKKSKTDGVFSTDQDWIPEHGRTSRKVGHGLNSSNTTTSCVKDQSKHNDSFSSRDSKYNGKDKLQVSIGKKRNIREYQDTQTHSTGNHVQESRVSMPDGLIASRKEKKARVSKSEGRESSSSKGSGRTDKKMSQTKNQKLRQDPGSTLSQRSLDGIDCLKGDLDSIQATAAATSSSSKVSGSHKTKAGFQEVKGSPVESVSSSPMRLLNPDKLTNKGKDDSFDAGAMGSPRCSDGEDDGGSDRSGTARRNKSLTLIHGKSHGFSKLDPQDKDVNHMSDTKFKAQTLSPEIASSRYTNGGVDTVGQDGTYPNREQIKDQCQSEERTDVYGANMSLPRKTDTGSCLKDNNESYRSESKGEKVKNASSLGQLQDQSPLLEANHRDNKSKLQEKFVFKSDTSENIHAGKKDCMGNDGRRKENQSRAKEFQEVNVDAIKQEALPSRSQNQSLDFDAERSSKRSISERTDQEILRKEKSLSMPPAGGAQIETLASCPQPSAGFHNGSGDLVVDPHKVDDAAKLQKKQIRKADLQNGTQHFGQKHPTLNGPRSKELDAPSPTRRDSSSHAANNAVKEAKDLKHLADRLKNSGSTESTGLYFQAALKFLHGASLLESGNNDAKHNEMIQSKQMYSSTAKLCEFCAHEYEKLKDMAGAALAYKCMEVAYMRVVYSSHYGASRDRHELQTALQIVPIGESPSSSASDIDNVNNSVVAEKFALPKGVSSPQVVGTHLIPGRNRSNIMRLLDFAQDVNFAMEASRKSRIAFAAANLSVIEGKHADGISSVKKALDFNFQDVEGLLRLVRLAMEVISR